MLTPNGIYYPGPYDVPQRHDLQDLAESVDTRVAPGPWTAIPLNAGYTSATFGGPPQICKLFGGHSYMLSGVVFKTAGNYANGDTLFTLPASWPIPATVYAQLPGSAASMIPVQIGTTRTLSLRAAPTVASQHLFLDGWILRGTP